MYLGLLQMQWLQILMPLSTGTLGLMLPLRFGAMCAIFSPAGNSINQLWNSLLSHFILGLLPDEAMSSEVATVWFFSFLGSREFSLRHLHTSTD